MAKNNFGEQCVSILEESGISFENGSYANPIMFRRNLRGYDIPSSSIWSALSSYELSDRIVKGYSICKKGNFVTSFGFANYLWVNLAEDRNPRRIIDREQNIWRSFLKLPADVRREIYSQDVIDLAIIGNYFDDLANGEETEVPEDLKELVAEMMMNLNEEDYNHLAGVLDLRMARGGAIDPSEERLWRFMGLHSSAFPERLTEKGVSEEAVRKVLS